MIKLPPFDKIGVTPTPDFQNASPASGITGSIVNGEIFNALQDELQNAIAGSGETPTDSDYTQILQVLAFGGIFIGTFGQTGDAYTAAIPGSVTIPALKTGMRISGFISTANTTTTPTLAVAGFTTGSAAAPIKRRGGASPAVGDVTVSLITFRFDGTNWRVDGLTPSDFAAGSTDSQIWHLGTAGGSANTITTTLSPVPASGAANYYLSIQHSTTNTGAAMLNGGPVIINSTGAALIGGEIPTVGRAQYFFDGTSYRLLGLKLSQLYAAEQIASAFTAGVVLSDIPSVGVDVVAQTVTITGASYIDALGACAFANQSATICGFTARLNLVGVTPTGPYLGGAGTQASQIPIGVSARWTGLNPATTYTLQLLVNKNASYGPIYVDDCRILARYGA